LVAIDIDDLIVPVAEDSPAGPDLSYDAARQEIEGAFEKSVSNDDGGDEVDWPDTIGKILAQATATRDVWLAVYLMRAGAKAGTLETVEDGANLLAGLFEAQWDTVHPQLDDYGYQGRKGPCESLTRIGEFLNPLRSVILLQHQRLGTYSGADFERFRKNGGSEDGYGMFRALLQDTSDDDLTGIVDRLNGISDAIRRADTVLTRNADGDTSTNFQPTYECLSEMSRSVASFLREPSADILADTDVGNNSNVGSDHGDQSSSFGGTINSRQDVLRAIDAIDNYYTRKEPGSPVPFALRRARDWVSLDFLSVLEDIAPNSLEEARRVLTNGRSSNGSDDSSSGGDDSWSNNDD
jgi:type VI secretion system ImpA family protein